jgi:4-hydroxy-tetrahydrodipicolinate synthase
MLRGAFTALVTPFRDGLFDEPAFCSLIDKQIDGGIHGLVPCGTTGESPTLNQVEHLRVIEVAVQAAKGRVPVVAGTGSNSTAEALELTRGAKELGATASLQITPYYNKPSQEGMIRHFTAIADDVDLPMIVYNVPGRTGVDLKPETVAKLAAHPRIVGIKEATGDMVRAAHLRELCGPDFILLSGDDFTLQPFLALGGDGVISVTSNVIPGKIARMCEAASAGRWDEARALHYQQLPLCRALFCQANPIPLKAAMAMLGHCTPEIRLPLTPVAADSADERLIAEALRALGLT